MRTFSVFTIAVLVATSALVLAAPSTTTTTTTDTVDPNLDYATGQKKEYKPLDGYECAPGYDTHYENGTIVPAKAVIPQPQPKPEIKPEPQPESYETDNKQVQPGTSSESSVNGYKTDRETTTTTTYGGQPSQASLEKEFNVDSYEVEEGTDCVEGYAFAEEVPEEEECPKGYISVGEYNAGLKKGLYNEGGDALDQQGQGEAARQNYGVNGGKGGSGSTDGSGSSSGTTDGQTGTETSDSTGKNEDGTPKNTPEQTGQDDKDDKDDKDNKDDKDDKKTTTGDDKKDGTSSAEQDAASSAFRTGAASSTVAVVAAMGAAIFVL